MGASKEDPPAGKPLVLFECGANAAVEVKPQAEPNAVTHPLTDLGLINIVQVHGPLQLSQWVHFENGFYHVGQEEGLYRFLKMPSTLRNLICVKSLTTTSSLIAVLGGISQLHVHGAAHVKADNLQTLAVTEAWLSLTCNEICNLAVEVLRQIGIKSRKVNVVTTRPENGYDDGHLVIEMQDPATRNWLLVDVDLGYVFRDPTTGQFLSASDFLTAVLADHKPEFVALSRGDIDFLWIEDNFHYAPWFKWRLSTEDDRWNWYGRVFQKIDSVIQTS